jgi:6-phosphogluconolactonase (cycloisomerase 2 family)
VNGWAAFGANSHTNLIKIFRKSGTSFVFHQNITGTTGTIKTVKFSYFGNYLIASNQNTRRIIIYQRSSSSSTATYS